MRAVVALLLLAAAAASGAFFADRPGQVEIVWQGWRASTSVGVLVAAVALVALVVTALALLVAALRRAPRHLARHRAGARRCCSATARSRCCSPPRQRAGRATRRRRSAPMPRCWSGRTPNFSGCGG